MVRTTAGATCVLALSASLSLLNAASPSIGVAISNGNIRINEAMTAGNANVFDGTRLQTDRATEVRMNSGSQLQFGTSSTAKLFKDHIVLEQGSAKFSGLSANANGLRISPDANASANVSLSGKIVQVAALRGSVHVFNAEGMNVANLLPGRALSLTPQDAGASAPSSMSGCVVKSGDIYTLTDETSSVKVQLRGSGLRDRRHVQVTGSMVSGATPAGGASQVVAVTSVKPLPGTCSATGVLAGGAAAGAGAAAAGAGAAGAGVGAAGAGAAAAGAVAGGIGATTAVVAGVAAAAVAGTAGAVAATTGGTPTTGANGATNCVGPSPCTF